MSRKNALLLLVSLTLIFSIFALLLPHLRFSESPDLRCREAEAAEILTGSDDAEAVRLELLPGEKLDINLADADQLRSLPGIGEALAERIVEYRNTHGSFTAAEEIMEVQGIGEKKFAAIAQSIEVGDGE